MHFEVDKTSLLSALNEWVSSGMLTRLQQTLGDRVVVDFASGQPITLGSDTESTIISFNDPEYVGAYNALTLLAQRVDSSTIGSSSTWWWVGLGLVGGAATLLLLIEWRRSAKRSGYRRRFGPASASTVRY